ncbi:unnamed protein product [Microthlaspi erraticum]|uniref:Uncharacterized protein n=1 Tax=Microthlaspi erraticum TaxID=1685480 RepID=A0A6D2LC05_9BRAS|nr:unnamed protein product [Microthlaspi erraticum]
MDCALPSTVSHGWRSICVGRDLLKPHVGRAIGDGKTTRVWSEPWISLDRQACPMGPPSEKTKDMLVAELLSPNTNSWDRKKLQEIIPQHENEILELQPSKLGAHDKYIWTPSESGIYSAKSGYYESLKTSEEESEGLENQTQDFDWIKNIWKVNTSQKTKMLMWRTMNGALPVGENLRARNINLNIICPHCGGEETTEHLLFHCTYAAQIWRKIPSKEQIEPMRIDTFKAGLELSPSIVCLPPTGIGEGPIFPWIVWAIWIARKNQLIFENCRQSQEETLTKALVAAREWQSAQHQIKRKEQNQSQAGRRDFSRGNLTRNRRGTTCKTDAAWRGDNKSAGFGWVFYNTMPDQREELIQQGEGATSHIRSPVMAEGMAMLMAFTRARDIGINTITIASDLLQLIKAINKESSSKELHGILHDILDLSLVFDSISFVHVAREANRQADGLAKNALRNFCSEPV